MTQRATATTGNSQTIVDIHCGAIRIAIPAAPATVRTDLRHYVPTCFWDAKLRWFIADIAQATNVVAWAQRHKIPVDDALLIQARPAPDTLVADFDGTFLVITTPPGHPVAAALSTCPWANQRATGDWATTSRNAARVTNIFLTLGLQVPQKVTSAVTHYEDNTQLNYRNSSATELPAGVPAPIVTGLKSTPMPLQAHGAYMAASSKRLILADEQGTGKTLQSTMAARIAGRESRKLLVVCPSSVVGNWTVELDTHYEPGTFTPHVATGKDPLKHPIPDTADTLIVGWAILDSWTDAITSWAPDMAIYDEAHYAKSGSEAARGAAFKATATSTADAGGRILALTGTPVSNRPLELLPLLEALGVVGDYGGPSGYKKRYCGPKHTQVHGQTKTTYTGHSNTAELNTLLRESGIYLRRTKQHLIDTGVLQPKYVDGVDYYDHTLGKPISIPGAPLVMGRYLRARDDIMRYIEQTVRQANPTATEAEIRKLVGWEGAKHLRELAVLRKLAAEAKVPYIFGITDELISQGEKVVICAHHREIVNAYADRYGGCKIQGAMSTKQIEAAKARFNETPVTETPVLVLSVEAGKTGHTLCKQRQYDAGPACARMIVAEQVWVPGDDAQMQDRIWRIGQDRAVKIANILAAGTVDEVVYGVRMKKKEVTDDVIDGDTTGLVAQLVMRLFDQTRAVAA